MRQSHGLTSREIARRCRWHESKCSRIENGHVNVSTVDIKAWVAACGEAEDAAADLIAMAENITRMYVEWRAMEQDGLKRAQESVLPLWEQTRRFKAYAQNYIPGPLQTDNYTRAVLAGIQVRRDLPNDVNAAVDVRMRKQNVLEEGGKQFAVVLEESVLHRRVAPPPVMVAQLTRLLEVSMSASVSLGIIPHDADRSIMPSVEDFWVFDDRVVNVELCSAFLTIKQRHEVKNYLDDFTRLSELAEHGGPVLTCIASAIHAYA